MDTETTKFVVDAGLKFAVVVGFIASMYAIAHSFIYAII